MEWTEIINHPSLQDLPFKIETNEWNKVVLTPITNKRGFLKVQVGQLFRFTNKKGNPAFNSSISTRKGIKVADVIWCSSEFFERNGYETPYQESPEVCVEIVSRSNSKREMMEKRKLYFECGAKEVWLCYESGMLEFYNSKEQISQSTIFADFPKSIEVFWKQ